MESLVTKFGADTSGFSKGVETCIAELQKYNKALVENQSKQKECNKTISEAQKEIKNIEKATKDKNTADEEQQKRIEQLKAVIEDEKNKLASLKTEQISIKQTISQTSKELANTKTATENADKATQDLTNDTEKMSDGFTVAKGAAADLVSKGLQVIASKAIEVGKAVVAIGQNFQATMSEVAAISGATGEELERLEKTAREYGASTQFSATESAEALKYMALAGWNTEQSIAALGSVLDLAVAGNTDLAKSSDIVTDYITAFGLSADDAAHFADVMAYAMSHSNTTVEMLGESYKNCAATAASMGFTLEDTTAALMTMANAGVKGGEAGTTLNAIMTRLATDTKGCASELKEMGIEIFDENNNLKSLSEILNLVTSAFDGMSDKQQAALSKVIAGQTQYTGLQTILKGMSEQAKEAGQSFNDYTVALQNADGTSQGMGKTMANNLRGDLKTMQSAFEELALKIYDSGETPIRNLVQLVTQKGVPALEALAQNIDKLIPVVVAGASAWAGYKVAVNVQSIVNGVRQAVISLTVAKAAETTATEGATAAQTALNTAQAANPIGLLVGAIGLLVGGLTSYSLISANATEKTTEYTESINSAKQAVEDYNTAVDSANDKHDNTIANAEAEAAEIEILAERYDKLKDKANLTAGEKELLKNTTEQLAEKLGTTVDKLKDENGAYIDLNSTIDDYIKKLKAKAELEATTDLYTEAVKARKQAQMELAKTEEKIAEMLTDHPELKNFVIGSKYEEDMTSLEKDFTQLNESYNKLSKSIKEATETEEIYKKQIDDVADSTSEAASETGGLSKSYGEQESSAEDLEKELERLNKMLEETNKTASTQRSELNSLANTYKSLADGQHLSYSNLLDLVAKYPEYADVLLQSANNADKQKEAIELLFEAKKQDYILTLQKAKDEIEASNAVTKEKVENAEKELQLYETSLAFQNKNFLVTTDLQKKTLSRLNEAKNKLSELRYELDKGKKSADSYYSAIKAMENMKIGTFTDTGSKSNSNGSSNSRVSSSSNNSSRTTYYATGSGETGTGSTWVAARINWVERMAAMGKATEKQQIEMLKRIQKQEKLTADESYNLRLKIKNLQEKIDKEQAQSISDLSEKRKQALKNQIDYATEAYKKLVENKQTQLENANDKIQKNADKRIEALDKKLSALDEKTKAETLTNQLKQLDSQLKYGRNNAQQRAELEHQKQELLNQQARENYEKQIEAQKAQIQENATAEMAKNTNALANLQSVAERIASALTKRAGTQTTSQVINNSSKTTNLNYVANGLNDKQLYDKFVKALG